MASETSNIPEQINDPDQLIRLPKVKALTTLSTSEIYRRIAAGTFPKQIILGPKSSVWTLGSVQAWRTALIQESQEEIV